MNEKPVLLLKFQFSFQQEQLLSELKHLLPGRQRLKAGRLLFSFSFLFVLQSCKGRKYSSKNTILKGNCERTDEAGISDVPEEIRLAVMPTK